MTPRRKLTIAIGAALLFLLWLTTRAEPVQASTRLSHSEILAAIRQVESSGRSNPPDGDGGRAIGPYQIHMPYWLDATGANPEIGGTYQDCRRRAYAERIIAAYMELYVADAWENLDAEVIARTHNGGPAGARKKATDRYWQRVQAAMR